MLDFKLIKKFLLIFVGVYALLLLAYHFAGLKEGYRSFLQAGGNSIFQAWWSDGFVVFKEGSLAQFKEMDTMMTLVNRKELEQALAENRPAAVTKEFYSSWQHGFFSTAFLLALILASPIPLKRKLIASGLGFLLITGFVFFRIWVNLEKVWNEHPNLGVVELSSTAEGIIGFLFGVLVENIVVALVVPLLIWILVTFRKEDWGPLLARGETKSAV